MQKRKLKLALLKGLDGISEVLDSSKFTIFWVSLLLISAILGLLLRLAG
jgi:hypothetical protein